MVKLKKVLSMVLVLGMLGTLASCKKNDTDTPSITGCRFDQASLNGEASYDGDVIKDQTAAKAYADLIIEKTLDKTLSHYKDIGIAFDSDNGIWVVSYGIDEDTLGGDIRVAFSKKTGEVLKIWFGE